MNQTTTKQTRTAKEYFNLAITTLISRFFRDKIRRGSISAVKLYIQTVNVLRLSTMALVGLGVLAAVLVSGICLIVVGIVGLLPIEPWAMAVTILGIGVLLAVVAGTTMALVFSQKRWLELSKSYQLMDAAMAPFEGAFPPNPVEIITGGAMSRAASKSAEAAKSAEAKASPSAPSRSATQYEPRLSDLSSGQFATPLAP